MLSVVFLNMEWLGIAAAICAAGVACLSLLLPSRSLTRVAFGLGMGLFALETLFCTLSSSSVSPEDAVGWQGLKTLVLSLVPSSWLLFSLVFARGNRNEFLARWWPGLVAALALPFILIYAWPGGMITGVAASAIGGGWWFGVSTKGSVFYALLLCSYILVLVNLERTFRASVGVMRWRMKFVIVGLGLLFVTRIYVSSQKLLYRGWDTSLDLMLGPVLVVACFLVVWSAVRCGLGEADVYPSRTVILGSVTFSIVGLYLLVVGVLAKGAAFLGGAPSLPLQALVVLVGLLLLGLFLVSDRARVWLSVTLSRHFRRPSYDYRDIWQRFTDRTVSAVDPAALCGVVATFISEVFHALSVTIWITELKTQTISFGGSTTMKPGQAQDLLVRARLPAAAWTELGEHDDLIELNAPPANGVHEFRALCTEQFKEKGGGRFVLPLRTREQLTGLLFLSDRVEGRRYTVEERDLLRTLGMEISALLLNLQLLQRRSEARETEALRTMAAFFAHDLKNTGSTLSLTLQNLRKHFGNPDFREDALQAVSKSVSHINHIVEGLSMLQRELKLTVRSEDLNAVVRQTLSEMETALTVKVASDLLTVPAVLLDSQQIKKVLVNLLLNASDAVSGDGRIEVKTGTRGKWAFLSVADNGCGMNTEFLRKSLFRPFQTTKKKGLGIGMFQSRMIVEAHGGRIEVESQINTGTTFQVLLPQIQETM